jgi:hypothetical protein
MFEHYKNLFLDEYVDGLIPFAEDIKHDIIEDFVRAFEPYKDEQLMIDPIEVAVAFNSEKIFNYLINNYDYTNYVNPLMLPLTMIILIFEREHLLVDLLEKYPLHDDQYYSMYEYMIKHHEFEYFKQFFELYNIDTQSYKTLLQSALENGTVFEYLIKQKAFKKYLKDDQIIYEILAFYPEYLKHIHFLKDLSHFIDTNIFQHIFSFENEMDFEICLDFLLARNIDINEINSYGLTLFHQALRHAIKPSYIYSLFERGGNPFFKTSKGYPSSHQLLYQDATFTLELSKIIDFESQDLLGLKLKDYDGIQRQRELKLLDILLVTKLTLNMSESAIYELDLEEFFDLADMHGVPLFLATYQVINFENSGLKDYFIDTMTNYFEFEEVDYLKHSFQNFFKHDKAITLDFIPDMATLSDKELNRLKKFAKQQQTTLRIQTDDLDINKCAHIEMIIDPKGKVTRLATITSHYADVYFIHRFYQVPLENITYSPVLKKQERFLN